MLRVWGRTNSSNVMKVLWLLDELGLAVERIDAGGAFGRTDTAEYRAMNPLGLVPTLEDDGFALFESNAILRYLCNAHAPGSPLYPTAPRARGTVDAWLDFQQTALNRPQSVVFAGLVRTPPEQRDNAAISAAVTEAGRIWGILDARLAQHARSSPATTLTLADIAFGVHVHRWFVMPIARPDSPHLHAWYERLLARARLPDGTSRSRWLNGHAGESGRPRRRHVQAGDEAARPACRGVALHRLPHPLPARAPVRLRHGERDVQRLGGLVGVVRIDQDARPPAPRAAPAKRLSTSAPGWSGSCAATNSFATRFMPSRSGVTSPIEAMR